jgi:riboflavin kinase/FMN adenylyltransferase
MKLVRNILEIPVTRKPVVLAMGCFDGVHIGHQKVISTAVEQAEARGGEAWVFTFSPHPAKILSPDTAPQLISVETCRLRQFEALGVHGAIVIPFDQTFAHTEPEQFLSGLWKKIPTLSGIVCGTDWSFGYQARGKFQALEKLCGEHDITATAIPPVVFNGERVSSTHIRQAVRDGDIPLAEQMLGRPFCIFGTVIKGRGVGRGLGFPTANVEPENELIPAPGVYAAWTKLQTADLRLQASAVFIGERKTFDNSDPVIEVYLLDFDGDLYGQPIEICLVQKIRLVEKFPSKEALVVQIKKDIAQIRGLLRQTER